VTTKHFLSAFGMETLRDLPGVEALEDAGLLSRRVVKDEPLSLEEGSEDE
jgi:chromosome segregation and condensation protein ScpB